MGKKQREIRKKSLWEADSLHREAGAAAENNAPLFLLQVVMNLKKREMLAFKKQAWWPVCATAHNC